MLNPLLNNGKSVAKQVKKSVCSENLKKYVKGIGEAVNGAFRRAAEHYILGKKIFKMGLYDRTARRKPQDIWV